MRAFVQLIDPDGSFVTAPHLRAFCGRLAAEGVRLEIATRLEPAEGECPAGTTVVPFPPFVRGAARNPRQWLGRLRRWLQQCRRRGRRGPSREPGALVAAVNPEGLLHADRHCARTGAPLVYFANEIIFLAEATSAGTRRFKERETVASRRAALVVASDERRSALLRDENRIAPDRLFELPVAPDGRARVRGSTGRGSFPGVPADGLVLLHAGSLQDWTGARELIEAVGSDGWPEDLRLLIQHPHGRIDPGLRAAIDPLIRRGRVILNCTRLSGSEYDRLLDAVDFGLVSYRATFRDPFHGRNISEIGLASGKFSAYVRAGLPVLAVAQRVYLDLNQRYAFGATFGSPAEIPSLASQVRPRAAECSAGAARLFDEELSFDRHWPALRTRLSALSDARFDGVTAS